MKCGVRAVIVTAIAIAMPLMSMAQMSSTVENLQTIINNLKDELTSDANLKDMMGIGQGIAAFAALWYIGYRVWKHLVNVEPIDFYPLFRPFCLCFAILNFGAVLDLTDGILQPTVTATDKMVKDSKFAIDNLLKQKEAAYKKTKVWKAFIGENGEGDYGKWLKYTHQIPEDAPEIVETAYEKFIGIDFIFNASKTAYRIKMAVKEVMSQILEVIFYAASLCLNTMRTFNLVILGLLGPITFGFAVFDGLQSSLSGWITRYINTFLWLPVCNIFGFLIGKIQQKMLLLDLKQIEDAGDTFFSSTDVCYLIFMLIAIIGYFTVPTVAGYIVNVGGINGFGQKVTSVMSQTSSTAVSVPTAIVGTAAGAVGKIK